MKRPIFRLAALACTTLVPACGDAGTATTGPTATTTTDTTSLTIEPSTGTPTTGPAAPPQPTTIDLPDPAIGPTITGAGAGSKIFASGVMGDLNSDGRDDLIVDDNSMIYVVLGSDAPQSIVLADADKGPGWLRISAPPFAATMYDGHHAGDLDGDGHDDLLAGYHTDTAELAIALLGGPEPDRPAKWQAQDPSVTLAFDASAMPFACNVGDVTGDGFDDHLRNRDMQAFLFRGGPHFTAGSVLTKHQVTTHHLDVQLFRCAGLGDVNGDGHRDFAVSSHAQSDDDITVGAVFVYFGGPDLPAELRAADLSAGVGGLRIRGASTNEPLGIESLVAAGDVDGDGLADLLFGSPAANAWSGAFYLVSGRGDTTAIDLAANPPGVTRLEAPFAVERLGVAVAGQLDLNLDGRPDITASSPCGLGGLDPCTNRVFVHNGAALPSLVDIAEGIALNTTWVFRSSLATDTSNTLQFGIYLATLDFDGDGRMDLAISAPDEDGSGSDSGRIHVVLAANL